MKRPQLRPLPPVTTSEPRSRWKKTNVAVTFVLVVTLLYLGFKVHQMGEIMDSLGLSSGANGILVLNNVKVRRLEVVNIQGETTLVMDTTEDGNGALCTFKDGKPMVRLNSSENNNGTVTTFQAGQPIVSMSMSDKGSGVITTYNLEGDDIVRISDNNEGEGAVAVMHKGAPASYLSSRSGGQGIMALLHESKIMVSGVATEGGGVLESLDKNGRRFGELVFSEETFEPGFASKNFAVSSHPRESYAVRLPQGYTTEKEYPVLFFLSTDGDGEAMINRYEDAWKDLEWIVVASNSYRAGLKDPFNPISHLERDVRSRFSVDKKKYYSAGFSWAGYMAAWMATQYPDNFAGVVCMSMPCHGAGNIGAKTSFNLIRGNSAVAVHVLCGEEDSFFQDLKLTHEVLSLGRKNLYFHPFDGGHVTSPPEIMREVLSLLGHPIDEPAETAGADVNRRQELAGLLQGFNPWVEGQKALSEPQLQRLQAFKAQHPEAPEAELVDRVVAVSQLK